jgi:hypothetical protein
MSSWSKFTGSGSRFHRAPLCLTPLPGPPNRGHGPGSAASYLGEKFEHGDDHVSLIESRADEIVIEPTSHLIPVR